MIDPIAVFVLLLGAATPILFAALGELVVERAGVLNLGVEGMMIGGALAGFAAAHATGSPAIGFAVAAVAGFFWAFMGWQKAKGALDAADARLELMEESRDSMAEFLKAQASQSARDEALQARDPHHHPYPLAILREFYAEL